MDYFNNGNFSKYELMRSLMMVKLQRNMSELFNVNFNINVNAVF